MKQNTITINGKTYPVIFTLLTISNFENITNKAIFEANLNTTTNRMAIIVAAALAADEKADITIEELRGNDTVEDYRQISDAFAIILPMILEFFHISDIEKKEEQPTDKSTEGEGVKN
jgi:hypothetical protein